MEDILKKWWWLGVIAIAVVFLLSVYSGQGRGRETALASNSEVANAEVARAELIPQIVETVKGCAKFETDFQQGYARERAKLGGIVQVDPAKLADPAIQKQLYEQGQQMASLFQRLMAVSERTPDTKCAQAFITAQQQFEGQTNRVRVARRDSIQAYRNYNASLIGVVAGPVANVAGHGKLAYYEPPADSRANPTVKF